MGAVVSRGVITRWLAAALLSLLMITSTGSVAGLAHAQPDRGDADPPDAGTVALTWPALGLGEKVYLGPDSTNTFTVRVPAGMTPVRLLGSIREPINIGAGFLEIGDGDGNFLAPVGLGPDASAQPVTTFDVDISAARVRARSMDLSFTLRQLDDFDAVCEPLRQLVLQDMAVVLTGAEPVPSTIANFFAPVLQRLTIYAPPDADSAEQQTVLTLASALARLYRLQPLAITVLTLPRGAAPPPTSQLTRSIVVDNGPVGLSLENPGQPGAYLRVSGRGDALTTQASLLVNQLQSLVQVPRARVEQPGSDAAPTADELTFGRLDMSGRTEVLRTGSLTVSVDRAALGPGRVDSVQVHLLADYTPVADYDAATVQILSNETVVYGQLLNSSGKLDATFDLDARALGQSIDLNFALTYTPGNLCGPLMAPMAFQVDPRSTLTMRRGGAPINGFAAFPSEFSPSFLVALDGSGPNQLSYAARVVSAIARLTDAPLTPQVVDLSEAADATTGALIVAKSGAIAQTSLNPPVRGDNAEIAFTLPTELTANIDEGLGSIQAFADSARNRSVILVTTTGSWPLVGPLFDYIDELDGDWSALFGDVLAAGAGGTAVNLAIRGGDNPFEAPVHLPQPESLVSKSLALGVIAAAGVIAVTLGAGILWIRRRRASSASPAVDPATDEQEHSV